jgi:hypothetical protein
MSRRKHRTGYRTFDKERLGRGNLGARPPIQGDLKHQQLMRLSADSDCKGYLKILVIGVLIFSGRRINLRLMSCWRCSYPPRLPRRGVILA